MKILSLLLFLLLTLCSFGAVSKKPYSNSLGIVMTQDNPNTYKEGSISNVAFLEDNALVVRIQPRGTFSLFTEDILFCPGALEKLQGKHNPLVFTYETRAHHMIEEIGCHTLVSVDEVAPQKELP